VFSKINPGQIVRAHWRSFTDDSTGEISAWEVALHTIVPAVVAGTYVNFADGISENAAGIVVSAASIAAGLLLNLLVLIYTLLYNAKSAADPIRNLDAFRQVCDEALATIAYCILLCLILVLSAFCSLAPKSSALSLTGQFGTLYVGTSIVLCLLIILKRVHALVHFEMVR